MTYDNTNKGVLWTNKKKEKESHPDWTGEIDIEGQKYWLSGWNKTSEKAGHFFSLSAKKKDFTPAKEAVKASEPEQEIPF